MTIPGIPSRADAPRGRDAWFPAWPPRAASSPDRAFLQRSAAALPRSWLEGLPAHPLEPPPARAFRQHRAAALPGTGQEGLPRHPLDPPQLPAEIIGVLHAGIEALAA